HTFREPKVRPRVDALDQAPLHTFATTRRAFLLGAAALALPLVGQAAAGWPRVLPSRPANAPKPSDVCFSSRFGDTSALQIAAAYHANRLDWCYSVSPQFMNTARSIGLRTLGGTLSSTLSDQVGGASTDVGRAVAQTGAPIVAPWMKAWGAHWGCINNPDYRATVLAHARAQLTAGVDYFTVDGANFNAALTPWGGCYCTYCQHAAREQDVDLTRDMQTFQVRSTIQFYQWLRLNLDSLAGQR